MGLREGGYYFVLLYYAKEDQCDTHVSGDDVNFTPLLLIYPNLESQLTVKVVGTGFRICLLVLLKLSASLDIDHVLCRGCKRPKEETISQSSELLSDKHTHTRTQTRKPEKHVT